MTGRDPRQRADGQRVGFVLARAAGIPWRRQFSAEDLRQIMLAVMQAANTGDEHTSLQRRALAHRLRQAAVALREGRQAEPGARCYACGRPV